jgi:molybdopterin-containing oxidoreductase family iron-sulfur binding subunit
MPHLSNEAHGTNRSDEFFSGASEWPEDLSRREFLRLMGASLALAGFTSCTKQPIERIVPYVKQPEEVVLGKPLRFATATQFSGYGQGLLVTGYEGRPTKIEGNPSHPASLGATTVWAQAEVLDLYDPDRTQTVTTGGAIKTADDFWNALNIAMEPQKVTGGATFRILTEPLTSPTLLAQLDDFLAKFPAARWCIWDPLNRDNSSAAEVIYDFSKANIIVALDSDFLYAHPYALRYARAFADARRVIEHGRARMSRFYAAEPTPTITGSNADHRIPVAARDILPLAEAIVARLGIGLLRSTNIDDRWVAAVVRDLSANRGASVVIAGETQPPEVHELVAQLNAALGNNGVTVLPAPTVPLPGNRIGFPELIGQMRRGAVELLVVMGGNPVYDAPVDLNFAAAFEKVKLRVHHSTDFNETSRHSHWHLPATHFLESWSDTRAFDGTVSVVQPLIEPIYAGISTHELLEALLGQTPRPNYDIVYSRWAGPTPALDFELKWRQALSDGFAGQLPPPAIASAKEENVQRSSAKAVASAAPNLQRSTSNLEVLFRPDVSVRDGRYANNGWLQELPRQFSKITWDNAALVSEALAQRERLDYGDVVELTYRGRTARVPIWIQPGQAENSVTLPLGYGREIVGHVGKNVGFNAYAVRTSDALWFGQGLTLRKTGQTHVFASTQHHYTVEGRGILHEGTLDQFKSDPKFAQKQEQLPPLDETLYDPSQYPYEGYKWGMVVDLNVCIGCHACTIACQAENNIPVVGKSQVLVHREMHWIRVDTLYTSERNLQFTHQPVPCMHCENAPCELVCPVGATVHDSEGLNLQIYNRCVGTRYCSNNCPYKVRRFNFLEYNNDLSPSEKLVKNPDVTVRSRGVMEKCTYCLQRINAARIHAELERRAIRDGEIVPACAQVCPVEAITFGNMNDKDSHLMRHKRSPLNYWMLGQLNTQPRTSYLAKLRNQNPDLPSL